VRETPQERAQAWCEEHAEHKSVPGTKFVSGRLLCSRDDVVKLLQPLEADVERLRGALRHAVEWLDEQGCDCGTDEPGTCALCEAHAALRGNGEK
jgi:hypothetical protein